MHVHVQVRLETRTGIVVDQIFTHPRSECRSHLSVVLFRTPSPRVERLWILECNKLRAVPRAPLATDMCDVNGAVPRAGPATYPMSTERAHASCKSPTCIVAGK